MFAITRSPGDQVSDMSDHKPTWLSFVDWEVYSPFEITGKMYENIQASIESIAQDVLMNKMAYAISSTIDTDGDVSSVLVMYRYNDTYHIAMLLSPEWKNLL